MPEGIISCYNNECSFYDADKSDNCGKTIKSIQKCVRAIVKKGGKSQSWYYDELMSNECACGKPKKRGMSFDYHCYKALPPEMQRALYKRISEDYEDAYEDACQWLTENIW